MQLNPGELPLLQQMVRQLTGVALDGSKGYLVESRLGPIAEQMGCANFNELYFRVRYGRDAALEAMVVDAITTHETIFFRDDAPYDALQYKLLPEVIEARERMGQGKKLRIWSAACSTGQEPYSMGIVLHEMLRDLSSWDIEILATDISRGTLETAARGCFADHEIARSARPKLTPKYFVKEGNTWRIQDSVRKLVKFKPLNLLDPFPSVGQFDVVFLRNVLIYFETATRHDIVRRLTRTLLPHGWLVVGSAENLLDVGPEYVPQTHCRATVYQPLMPPVARR
ncbi:MAG: protein-glutamate O-methyltransferase CheR [Planctomycetes bacterium]|nr:protein-glutamate O-methyltransferase CheR [Planctomycetota bacterium]